MSYFTTHSIKDISRRRQMVAAPAIVRLQWAAARMKHHRKWGPGHEIAHAIADLDAALAELGFGTEEDSLDLALRRMEAKAMKETTE